MEPKIVNISNEGIGPWTCDVCEREITNVDDGYLVWKLNADSKYHEFKIIHRDVCDNDDSFSSSLALEEFVGYDGLNKLLSLLSVGEVMLNVAGKTDDGDNKYTPESMREFVDLVRRVQLPNYEQIRPKFKDPGYLVDMGDADEDYPYTQHAMCIKQRLQAIF